MFTDCGIFRLMTKFPELICLTYNTRSYEELINRGCNGGTLGIYNSHCYAPVKKTVQYLSFSL